VTVAEVEKDSPSSASTIRSGDEIVMVDGQDIKGMTVDECASLMRGARPRLDQHGGSGNLFPT
jgi:C-terminal processing protease CtpA/Prc